MADQMFLRRHGAKTASPVTWQEHLILIDVEADSDEGFDDLLEAVEPTATPEERAAVQEALSQMSIEEGEEAPSPRAALPVSASIRRATMSTGNRQLSTSPLVKKAAATNWDTEFSNAQAHARDVLAKLGR
jgi:hypothetical protein